MRQALTGDRTVDLTEVAFDAAGGAGSGVANDYFSARLLLGRDAPTPLALAAGPQRLALPAGAATETVATFRGGGDVVALQIEGTIQGIAFKYYGYYWSGKSGTVQFLTYTSQNLFEDAVADFTELLSGFVITQS